MDNKELLMMMIKMENNHNYLDDTITAADQKSCLGFMDLLGYQDYYNSSSFIYDDNNNNHYNNNSDEPPLLLPSASSLSMEMDVATSSDNHHLKYIKKNEEEDLITTGNGVDEESSSVVLNGQQPSSPNSCSISTSPSHQQLHKPIKQCMKGKKTSLDGEETKTNKKKKVKEAKFAFMTRSEIDHLDDGYRWRKYGQKAVKNSHFPRSYYKCTSASCNVKKRVERCMNDPSYVVTTYEGQHIHIPPSSLRTSLSNTYTFNHLINPPTSAFNTATIATKYANSAMLKLDQGGLLQDMLPCHQ
ncbi:uncharacterized protein [Rutidosis leptorrhynchoides]|uniref:uncharacterized protein n=1 Tax=Rutidosis leptorrhynchoides TaxID=125765 RepID=UPI003A9A521C